MLETNVVMNGKYWREYLHGVGEVSSVNFEDSYQVHSKEVIT